MAISLSHTFVANTTIQSAQVNANFSTLATRALDKTGDTMTGSLLFTDATYDIGASGATRPRDLHLSRNAVVPGTLNVGGVLTFTSTLVGAIVTSTVGGHAFGLAGNARFQLQMGGSFAPSGAGGHDIGFYATTAIALQANAVGSIAYLNGAVTEAGSGTHAVVAQLRLAALTITNGAAATTESATLYIDGPASGATSNYSLHIASGETLFSGLTTLSGGSRDLAYHMDQGIVTPSQITASQNDYNPTGLANARILRLSSDASRNITGIVAQGTGFRLLIQNVGAQDIVLVHASGSSAAANRIQGIGGASVTLNTEDAAELWYDPTSTVWRVIGR